jgi:hypothetical protein
MLVFGLCRACLRTWLICMFNRQVHKSCVLGDSARIATLIRSTSHVVHSRSNRNLDMRFEILRRAWVLGTLPSYLDICRTTSYSKAHLHQWCYAQAVMRTRTSTLAPRQRLFFLHSGRIANQLLTESEPHSCMKISEDGGEEADFEMAV